MPAELAHATLIRACLRDTVSFRTDDQERSFLVAVTEVMVNAIESTGVEPGADGRRSPIVVELFGPPEPCVVVTDFARTSAPTSATSGLRGVGRTIADAFVAELDIDTDAFGTRVRLGLPGTTG